MAWKDLLVRVGMDSRGFAKGANDLKRDTQGMRNSMAQLATEMRRQRDQLRQLGQSGKGASNEYRALKSAISENNGMFRAMSRELRAVEMAQGKVKVGAGEMGSSLSMVASGFVGGALALGANKVLDIGRAAIETQMEFEKLGVVLTNTLGSSSAAQSALKDIQTFAAATPFQVDELSESFLRLANRGMKPTMEQMRQMGDLAASQGKSFIQLTEAILDAATGEFERLKEFGIKGSKEGNKVTLMFKNQKVEVENTAEAISDAIRAMGDYEGVAGGMAAISGTLSGKVSNLKDNWSLLLNSLGGLKTIATVVVDGLNSMLGGLRKFSAGSLQIATNWGEMRAFMAMGGNPFLRWQKGAEDVAGEVQNIKKVTKEAEALLSGINNFTFGFNPQEQSAPTGVWAVKSPSKDIYTKLQKDLEVTKKALYAIGEGHKYAAESASKSKAAIKEMYEVGGEGAEYYIGLIKQKIKIEGTENKALSAYQDLQKELQTTREYLKFVGQENEYIGEAMRKVQSGMESIFKMGGKDALQYSALLQEELKVLKAQADRAQMAGPVAQIGMVSPKGKFEMPKGMDSQVQVMGKLALEMQRITSSAAAFGSEYDVMGAQITTVSNMIAQAISGEMEMSMSTYQGLIDKLNELKLAREEQLQAGLDSEAQTQRTMALMQTAAQVSGAYFETLAAGSASAGDALRGLALSALDAAQSIIMANLAAASSAIAKWAANLGPAGPIVPAAGIAALFGMVKGAIGKSKGVKLAKGGIAYGETAAVVGDNPGAKFDPEVIAPLSKLQGMLETRETVGGTFRIDGADLVLAYDNAKRKTKAFGR